MRARRAGGRSAARRFLLAAPRRLTAVRRRCTIPPMENFNPDSYCGLYCGACDIQVSSKTGAKTRFARFWNPKFLRKFIRANGIEISDEDDIKIACKGCKSNEVFINCRYCRIRDCASSKAVAHCSDCAQYPCDKFEEIGKGAGLLPHLRSISENLAEIGKRGAEGWRSGQARRWSCPDCGAQFSWYSDRCPGCGKRLGNKAYKFTFLASLILRGGLKALAKKQKAALESRAAGGR